MNLYGALFISPLDPLFQFFTQNSTFYAAKNVLGNS